MRPVCASKMMANFEAVKKMKGEEAPASVVVKKPSDEEKRSYWVAGRAKQVEKKSAEATPK